MYWSESAKGCEDAEVLGSSELHGEAERDGIVQPREEKALLHVYKYLTGV